MLILFHNSRCSKSRKAKEILDESGVVFKVREYLKEPLSKRELSELAAKLDLNADQFMRGKESILQAENIDVSTPQKCFNAILQYPILLERPILASTDAAVIGRPIENIESFINKAIV